MTDDEHWYVEHVEENDETEVDCQAIVSTGDDDGAWIQTWTWVEEGPLSIHKGCEGCGGRGIYEERSPGKFYCPDCAAELDTLPGDYVGLVHVLRTVPVQQLTDPEDRAADPSGTYDVSVTIAKGEDPEPRLLDVFHATVPIGCLDDFEITVDHVEKVGHGETQDASTGVG